MPQLKQQQVLLNSVEHQQLRIITRRGAEFGDNLWFSATFPLEFRSVQACYPIFFHQDSKTGQLYPVALFGFSQGENLFLQHNNWQDTYIPLTVRRQPFLIGQQKVREDGVEHIQRVIHLDLHNPRVSETEGEALFLPFGGNTPFLDEMAAMLETIHLGMQDSVAFVDVLTKLNLLEAVTLDLTLHNGSKHQLIGFYTIHEERLAQLDANAIVTLQQQGYLAAIYFVLASQSRLRELIRLKSLQISQQQHNSAGVSAA